jgi:glycosyltransferase involved in cell wall biosynthesis
MQKVLRPRVSIVIPVYNGSNYLAQAIDSALAQTYNNVEVIVINDGSNDGGATESIAKAYGDRIRYYKKKNGGVSTALNLGIKKMKGEYFSWLSHDDTYKPFKIEKQVEFLSAIGRRDIVLYSDYEIINEKSELIEKCVLDHDMLERVPMYAFLRGAVNGITLLIPKKAFDEHGYFNTSLRCAQDYDMWLRILEGYDFIHQAEILSQTRSHSFQDTVRNPAAVSEGNALWQRMIRELADKSKVQAEGSLFKFYLEMLRFISSTPYEEAIKYCEDKLESTIRDEGTAVNCEQADAIFELLLQTRQKRTAAYFMSKVLRNSEYKKDSTVLEVLIKENLLGQDQDCDLVSLIHDKKLKMKRLMFCSGHWLTGGMERVLSIVFEQLRNEYEIFLVTPFDGRKGKIEVPSYVHHIRVSDDFFYSRFDVIALSLAITLRVNVLIGFMNIFDKQLSLYDLCQGTGIRTVASNHEIYFYPYHNVNLYELVAQRSKAFNKVDVTLWLTNFSAAAHGLVANNSYLMPNPNTFPIKSGHSASDDYTILCVGRFTDYIKRVDRILHCFSVVSKRIPAARLILVGKCSRTTPFMPADDRTVDDLIKELHIDENKIEFVGEVNNVEEYYAKASVLLLTSNNEGFGMVVNEAACYGVPTVCMKIPGLEDLIINDKTGYIVDQDDIESLSSSVEKLLQNENLRIKMGSMAKEHVRKFDRSEIGARWKYLLNTLLASGISDQDIETELRKKLDYKIDDYRLYSRIMLNEMNMAARMVLSGPVREDLRRVQVENEQLREMVEELGDSLVEIRESKRWIITSRAIELTIGKLRRIYDRHDRVRKET